jgi:hypothetical protein
MEHPWFRSTPGAIQLLATARLCPDAASFSAQLDTLRQLSGVDFVNLAA